MFPEPGVHKAQKTAQSPRKIGIDLVVRLRKSDFAILSEKNYDSEALRVCTVRGQEWMGHKEASLPRRLSFGASDTER